MDSEDIEHGETVDLTVEVRAETADAPFPCSRVTGHGSDSYLLVGTGSGVPEAVDGEGNRLRLDGAIYYDVALDRERRETIEYERKVCPECGASGRYDPGVDLPSAVEDALDAPRRSDDVAGLLLVGSDTDVEVVEHADDTDERDDWQGQVGDTHGDLELQADPWDQPGPGAFVCSECGHRTDGPAVPAKTMSSTRADASMASLDTGAEMQQMAAGAAGGASADADLGMATGGAKDAENFRDNVEEGYVPEPEAMSVEGLFYDYYFQTGAREPDDSDALFYPTYSAAVSADPLTDETERYLAVGLNSTLSTADFDRKRLDLVVVLDVSGSMSSHFEEYYYDEQGNRREVDDPGDETKMAAAREALVGLTRHLDDDDRLGVVLYNADSCVAKPLREVGRTDMDAIRGHVRDLTAGGGTNMAAGFRTGRQLLADEPAADPTEVERRVVFMTDAMPNIGTTGQSDLVDLVDEAAGDGIHTTFVGMGLDANAELVDALSGVRGANHYFVHSGEEFTRRLDDEFAYMVTPLVYDLSLDLVADGYEIADVYGSPNADAATGEVMHVETLFPSPTRDGETRGGVVLLELAETGAGSDLELVASWEQRDGSHRRDALTVEFPADGPEHFDDDGVRKAVLLARYASLLQDWAEAIHEGQFADETEEEEASDEEDGDGDDDEEIDDWEPLDDDDIEDVSLDDLGEVDVELDDDLGEWEQQSVELTVPDEYADLFEQFRDHLVREREAIGDDDLQRELDLLEELLEAA